MKTQTASGSEVLRPVATGFPSPAEDVIDKHLDLNEYLIKSPASTFMMKVSGNSLEEQGILSGDMLIVDRSLQLKTECLAVVVIDGEFVLKQIEIVNKKLFIVPSNQTFKRRELVNSDFEVWGVVAAVIRNMLTV